MSTQFQAITLSSTKDLPHNEWLKLRCKGIGGSDAAAIVGLSPWSSPLSVYLDKKGLSAEKTATEPMRQGTDLEEYVARRFMEDTGKTVRRCNFLLQSPDHPFMIANVDRLVVGERAGLECKTTSPFNRKGYEEGEIPPNYYVQCQHYMSVTGLPKWYLAVLVLGTAFHVFEIDRNEDDIAALIAAEEKFWNLHVVASVPPAPTGSSADGEALSHLFPHSTDTEIPLYGLETTAETILALKDQKKALEEQIALHEQTLKASMQDAERGILKGYKASWKSSVRTTLDAKALALDRPDIYDAYKKTTNTRTFTLRRTKE